jgi:hypothetical protein
MAHEQILGNANSDIDRPGSGGTRTRDMRGGRQENLSAPSDARPQLIQWGNEGPKTHSGKIMCRIWRQDTENSIEAPGVFPTLTHRSGVNDFNASIMNKG